MSIDELCAELKELDDWIDRDLTRVAPNKPRALQWFKVITELEHYLREARGSFKNSDEDELQRLVAELREEATTRRLMSRGLNRNDLLVGIEGDHVETYERVAEGIENGEFGHVQHSVLDTHRLRFKCYVDSMPVFAEQILGRSKKRTAIRRELRRRGLNPHEVCQ